MGDKKLTPKQLHFARCIAGGMTQSDAYREAYTVRDSTTQESIHSSASRLMSDVKVSARVKHLIGLRERAVVASAVTDRERVLSKLRGWMDDAEPTDTNKIKAAQLLGQSVGMFKDVIETSTNDRESSEIAVEIERRLAALQDRAESEEDQPTANDLH